MLGRSDPLLMMLNAITIACVAGFASDDWAEARTNGGSSTCLGKRAPNLNKPTFLNIIYDDEVTVSSRCNRGHAAVDRLKLQDSHHGAPPLGSVAAATAIIARVA